MWTHGPEKLSHSRHFVLWVPRWVDPLLIRSLFKKNFGRQRTTVLLRVTLGDQTCRISLGWEGGVFFYFVVGLEFLLLCVVFWDHLYRLCTLFWEGSRFMVCTSPHHYKVTIDLEVINTRIFLLTMGHESTSRDWGYRLFFLVLRNFFTDENLDPRTLSVPFNPRRMSRS